MLSVALRCAGDEEDEANDEDVGVPGASVSPPSLAAKSSTEPSVVLTLERLRCREHCSSDAAAGQLLGHAHGSSAAAGENSAAVGDNLRGDEPGESQAPGGGASPGSPASIGGAAKGITERAGIAHMPGGAVRHVLASFKL